MYDQVNPKLRFVKVIQEQNGVRGTGQVQRPRAGLIALPGK